MRSLYLKLTAFFIVLCCIPTIASAEPAKAPGLGDAGTLQALRLETGRGKPGAIVLSGRDAGRQLVVTGTYSSAQVRDLTHGVQYEVTPAGIISVDATGYMSAFQEGKATLRASTTNVSVAVEVTVVNIVNDVPINFTNDIVPIFTRFGCNAGGCHGKSGGQNGFQLSLLGFEPAEDYEYLVKESRGRRIMLSAPEASLLLMKATGQMPHGCTPIRRTTASSNAGSSKPSPSGIRTIRSSRASKCCRRIA